jgi:NADPH-dependent curcumin reductase CurA
MSSSTVSNRSLVFNSVPKNFPIPGENLIIEESKFDTAQEPPKDGVTLRMHYSSVDPYMRGRMRGPEVKSYSPPFTLHKVIDSLGIGKIIKSNHPSLKEGDLVTGSLNIEEYSVLEKPKADALKKLDNPLGLDPVIFIGTLGMPGLTAYSSYYAIGKPKKGETIFISAASGAVGQLVAQLAKRDGLKVIGSVGSDEKKEYLLKELNLDGAFNYKTEKPAEALDRLAPDGIDIYYENVGGEQLEASIDRMKTHGRIVACGMVSEYNKGLDEKYPIRNLMQVVAKRIVMTGFIVGDADLGPKYREEFVKNVSQWAKDGSLKVLMSVTEGIENSAEGLVGMLQGKNMGKAVLKIADLK